MCDKYVVLAFLSVLDRGFEPIFWLSSLLVSFHLRANSEHSAPSGLMALLSLSITDHKGSFAHMYILWLGGLAHLEEDKKVKAPEVSQIWIGRKSRLLRFVARYFTWLTVDEVCCEVCAT